MSSSTESKKIVEEFLHAFSAGDHATAFALLDDSATWWVAGKIEGLSGTKDKATFAQEVAGAGQIMKEPLRLTPIAWTVDGERVAVELESYAELTDGRLYENTYHNTFIVRDGKIRSVREYPDTDTAKVTFFGG